MANSAKIEKTSDNILSFFLRSLNAVRMYTWWRCYCCCFFILAFLFVEERRRKRRTTPKHYSVSTNMSYRDERSFISFVMNNFDLTTTYLPVPYRIYFIILHFLRLTAKSACIICKRNLSGNSRGFS